MEKQGQSTKKLWNNFKIYNIHIIRIPDEKRENRNIWCKNDEEFSKLMINTKLHK